MTVLTSFNHKISLELRAEIEDFFYQEADFIDERRFKEWLEMLHDDI